MKNKTLSPIVVGVCVALLAPLCSQANAAGSQPPVPAWEGFYLGAAVGYGDGVNNISPPYGSNFLSSHGGVISGLGGYNHMLTPRWLLGIEADASWANLVHAESVTDDFGDFDNVQFKQSEAYSVRGRVGYLLAPETLLYATAGWGWSEFAYSFAEDSDYSETDTHWLGGPVIGASVETMFAPGWSARLEYLQTFYSSGTFNSLLAEDISGESLTAKPTIGVARVGVIRHFGADGAEAWNMPAPAPSWNGVYVGAALGAGIGSAKLESNADSTDYVMDGVGASGVFPTAIAGYNWRVAPRWVLGLEGELAPGISTSDFRIDLTESLHARVGYLLTPATMVYGTSGWLGTGIRATGLVDGEVSIPSQRINALELGGGVETALNDHWAARFDYQLALAQPIDDVVVTFPTFSAPINARTQIQYANVGLVYMFGGR